MSVLQILISGFIISLVITSIGFRKTVWFVSIGYTLAIVVLCIYSIFFIKIPLSICNYLQVLLLLFWGTRLGFYIYRRESDENYNSNGKEQTDSSRGLSLMAKFGIWVSVSLLYICMYSPALFALQGSQRSSILTNILVIFGLLIMGTGITLETIADYQKSMFKKIKPKSYCKRGLYKWVRCPNYLGEIMVWLGNFICAFSFYSSWWQWTIATIGLLSIVLIMMGAAKRLEKKQSLTYGENPDFQKYEKSVPILFPWIRLYSLKNIKVYLE